MKRIALLIILISYLVLSSCSEDAYRSEYGSKTYGPFATLFIFGGANADVYLGSLNGSKYNSESIWNEYGQYGSKYRTNCIWNEYGTYGSEYSSYSPFNEFASHPPVLKDASGTSYGYFTVNKYKTGRARYDLVDEICEHYEEIRNDVSGWYDRLF